MPTDATTAARIGAAKLKLALSRLLHAEIGRLDTTVHAVGVAAGLSDQTVRDIFAGASLPRLDVLRAIERAIDRPYGWLSAQLPG